MGIKFIKYLSIQTRNVNLGKKLYPPREITLKAVKYEKNHVEVDRTGSVSSEWWDKLSTSQRVSNNFDRIVEWEW